MTTNRYATKPLSADEQHRFSAIYSHSSSKEQREAETRQPPKVLVDLTNRQSNQTAELVEKHRAAHAEMNRRHATELHNQHAVRNGGAAPHEVVRRHRKERQELNNKLGAERAALDRRHRTEMAEARDFEA